jgi:hypothetical protein
MRDTITEQEFLEAVKIIRKYKLQVERMTEETLRETGIMKTPAEIESNWQKHFPNMSIRLWNILIYNYENVRICDITIEQLRRTRNVGAKTIIEFSEITGKEWY